MVEEDIGMETITFQPLTDLKVFPADCVWTLEDKEGNPIKIGVARAGATFNPWRHDSAAVLIRLQTCETFEEAKKERRRRRYLGMDESPQGRPRGAKDKAPGRRRILRPEDMTPDQLKRLDDPDWQPETMGRKGAPEMDIDRFLTEDQKSKRWDPEFMDCYYTPDWDAMRERIAEEHEKQKGEDE
jgi:hypothetical protein